MLTIKDLAEILVQKHQLDSQSAEMFMNAIIETIHEGLKNDRIVKVKGFGTFKLTAVRDRESINVNTGERVVISGHDKVSFTPDAVLRDLVNKPFAQFDTVVLADGVDFEDMPEMDTEDADAVGEDVADIPVDVQPEAKVVAMQVAQEPESEKVSVPEVEKPVAEEPQLEEPEEPNTPDVQEEIPENPETPEIPEAPETPSKEPEQKQKQEEQEPEEVQEDYISAFYDEEDSDRRNMFLIYAIIANVVVAALFFMFGYYARSNNLLGIEPEEKTAVETPAPIPAAEQQDTAKQKPVASETPVETEVKEASVEKKGEPAEEKKPVAEPKKEEKPAVQTETVSKYDNDPRVRTGAYRIVGVANTVTVRSGQTIKSISKTYLGPGMECYVEVLNGGITELKEGQTIKIPKLALKKKAQKAKK